MQPVYANSAENFAELLKAPFPPTKLCLGEMQLTLPQAQIIAGAIRKTDLLESLYLVKCDLTAFTLRDIVDALKDNKSVTYLDLWNNRIDDTGAQMLADLIKVRKILTTLNVSNNKITKAGAAIIAEAAGSSNTLAHLFIEHNYDLSEKVPEVFLNPMKHNRSLCTLKLSPFQEKEAWLEEEDLRTVQSFLKENRTKPREICNYLLCQHDLRFGFNRQRIILLGARKSGKTLLWRNLTSSNPPKEGDLEYYPTEGFRFHVATSLTSNPFLKVIFEDESFYLLNNEEHCDFPDMVLDAVMKLGNKLLDIEHTNRYFQGSIKPRRSYNKIVSNNSGKSNRSFSQLPVNISPERMTEKRSQTRRTTNHKSGTKRGLKLDLGVGFGGDRSASRRISARDKANFIGLPNDSLRVTPSPDGKMYEFQKLAIKFAQRHVRKVDNDIFIPKKEVVKQEITNNISVKDHIARFEKLGKKKGVTITKEIIRKGRLTDKEKKRKKKSAGPTPKKIIKKSIILAAKSMKVNEIIEEEEIDQEDTKSNIEFIRRDHQLEIQKDPLNCQNPFSHNWFLKRRGKLKSINYTCTEIGGNSLLESFANVIYPSSEFGISIVCFNLGELDLDIYKQNHSQETWRRLYYWLNFIYRKYSRNRDALQDINGGKIIIVGTHLDVLENKDTDSTGVLLKASSMIKKIKNKLEKDYMGLATSLIIENSRQTTTMFFPVNNVSGQGVKEVYKAIQNTSRYQNYVRKSISLREYALLDHIRPQALLKQDNTVPIAFTQQDIEEMCRVRNIAPERATHLLKLFSDGSGLGYWFRKNQIIFKDFAILDRLAEVVFILKVDFLGRQVDITVESLTTFHIEEEQIIEQGELAFERRPYSLLRWGRSGRYFIDLLKEALLVCSLTENQISQGMRDRLHGFNDMLDDVVGDVESSDSSSDGSSEIVVNYQEYLFIPYFLKQGPTETFNGEPCFIHFGYRNEGVAAEAFYQNMLCMLLPWLANFRQTENFVLYSNYAIISFQELEFVLMAESFGCAVTVEDNKSTRAYFILKLIELVVQETQLRLGIPFTRKILFDSDGEINMEKAKKQQLEPWFLHDTEDLENAFDDFDACPTPIELKEIFDELVSGTDDTL